MATKRLPPFSPILETTLIDLALNDREEAARNHAYALLLLAHGQSAVAVARQLNVARRTLYNWIDRFRADGIDSVTAEPLRGWRRKVTPAYLQRLEELLASDPYSFHKQFPATPHSGWTARRLSRQLAADTDITLSAKQLRELLTEAGYVYGKKRIVRIKSHFLSAFWFKLVWKESPLKDLHWRTKEAVIVHGWTTRRTIGAAERQLAEKARREAEGAGASKPEDSDEAIGWRITDDPVMREKLERAERLVQRQFGLPPRLDIAQPEDGEA